MQTLKELRKSKGLTQKEAAELTQIPLRTYKNYENEPSKEGSIKYHYIFDVIKQYGYIDEEHGILELADIRSACESVFDEYDAEFAILFGSYARGMASESSDVDILVSSDVKGLKFYGMVEKLRNMLKKKVDLLDMNQLIDNQELLKEILKDGVRIYG